MTPIGVKRQRRQQRDPVMIQQAAARHLCREMSMRQPAAWLRRRRRRHQRITASGESMSDMIGIFSLQTLSAYDDSSLSSSRVEFRRFGARFFSEEKPNHLLYESAQRLAVEIKQSVMHFECKKTVVSESRRHSLASLVKRRTLNSASWIFERYNRDRPRIPGCAAGGSYRRGSGRYLKLVK